MATVGIVSPGAMGSAIGRVLADGGPASSRQLPVAASARERLAEGLELLPDLQDVVAASEIVLSVVPPGEARAVADGDRAAAAETGARPLVADLNAVSPATAAAVAARLAGAGLEAVDGSISGPPPRRAGTTVVYLSGPAAARVADLRRARARAARRRPARSGRRRRSRCRPRPSTRARRRSSRRRSGRLGRTACSSSCWTTSGAAIPSSSTTRRGCSRASRRSPVATSPRWRRSPQTQAAAGLTPDLFAAYATIYAGLSTFGSRPPVARGGGSGRRARRRARLARPLSTLAREPQAEPAGERGDEARQRIRLVAAVVGVVAAARALRGSRCRRRSGTAPAGTASARARRRRGR